LTSQPRPDGRNISYLCRAAHNQNHAGHSRPYSVSARYIDAAARIEATHFHAPADEIEEPDNAGALAALEAEIARLLYQHTKHYIGDAELDAAIAPILARKAALARGSVEAIPQAIDFDLPPDRLNIALRAIWTAIVLGPDLRPGSQTFEWRFPEWRRP